MAASVQLHIPPMELQRVGNPLPTPANSVAAVDLATAVLRAGARLGMADKELAAVFGLSAPDFSKSFSPNYADRNRTMKTALPVPLLRELAMVLCEEAGLNVAGPDAVKHALADVMDAMSRAFRVMAR